MIKRGKDMKQKFEFKITPLSPTFEDVELEIDATLIRDALLYSLTY